MRHLSRKQLQPQQISKPPTFPQQTRQGLQGKLKPSYNIAVGRRLEHFYQNWTRVTNNKWVLQAINGHHLEFHRIPRDSTHCYQRELNQEQTVALDKEVQHLLEKGAIEEILGPGGFYSPVCGTKEGWRVVPDHQFEMPESVPMYNPFQDGKHSQPKGCPQEGRLYDQSRS